jgi:multiple sugar transport system permease protein
MRMSTGILLAVLLAAASHGRVFFSIIVPLARPVLLVVALISFQAHWNDFLGPLVYLNDQSQYTMTMGLHYFQATYTGDAPKWHWMMAVTTLMAIPTVAIFFFTQRSLSAGAGRRAALRV